MKNISYVNEDNYYSKKVGMKIEKMLYMYNELDDLINERREEIIHNINNSVNTFLKAKKQNVNNLDWAIIKLSNDKKIIEYKKWKKLINSYISKLQDKENKKYYYFIKYYYNAKFETEKVMELLNIDINEFHYLKIKIKRDVYLKALEDGIFQEEVKI